MRVGRFWFVRLRQAIAQDVNRRVDLSLFPLVRDRPEHGEDILHRGEVIPAIAQDMDDSNDAPVLQFPQASAGIGTRNAERIGDLIRGQGLLGKEEQSVHLGHRAINAPARAHLSPMENEFLRDGREVCHKYQSVLSKQK